MKRWEFLTSLVLGILCLGLSIGAIATGRANQRLQVELQAQQAEINKGAVSQQVGTNLVRDIAVAATANERLRELLARNGFTLTVNASPSPAPTP